MVAVAGAVVGMSVPADKFDLLWLIAGVCLVSGIVVGLLVGEIAGAVWAALLICGSIFLAYIVLIATFFGSGSEVVVAQEVVAVAQQESSGGIRLKLMVKTLTESTYKYTAVPVIIFFFVLCLVGSLFSSDHEFTAFFMLAIAVLFFITGAVEHGEMVRFFVSFAIAIVTYILLGYLYSIVWYKQRIADRYAPYYERLESFLKDNEISLPQGSTIEDFDTATLNDVMRPKWVDALKNDPWAFEAAEAIKTQNEKYESSHVLNVIMSWPLVFFGDFFKKLHLLLLGKLGDALKSPFRQRARKQVKNIRSIDDLE